MERESGATQSLSDDSLELIFQFLSPKEIVVIERTCKRFQRISNRGLTWKNILIRRKWIHPTNLKPLDWKKIYQDRQVGINAIIDEHRVAAGKIQSTIQDYKQKQEDQFMIKLKSSRERQKNNSCDF
jgi:hypothetical protein